MNDSEELHSLRTAIKHREQMYNDLLWFAMEFYEMNKDCVAGPEAVALVRKFKNEYLSNDPQERIGRIKKELQELTARQIEICARKDILLKTLGDLQRS